MTQAPWAQREILNQKMRFEAICDQFEGACRSGQQPLIQDYVLRVPDQEREALAEELLAIERDYRGHPGPRVTLPKDDPPPPIDVESTVMLPPPTKVPSSSRYRILRLHARGGMGEVWLADDLAIGRRVAYKRIRDDRKPYGERFVIEAQITGQLEHPGVVPVHDLGEDADGHPFYVMRFVKGQTLKEIVVQAHEEMTRQPKSRELCLVKLLEIYLTVCRTVAYAHHRGVIHRDIKPDNIMVGSFGETMVIDWGLAKVLDSPDWLLSQPVHPTPGNGSTATLEGNVVGSLPYIAPEGAEGKIDEIDVKTDVYLLGGTLYEILTGRPPRQGSSREEFIELARNTTPKPPRQVNPDAPRALEALCQRAMAREKRDRYDSAEELAAEVERYLAGDRVRAYSEPWTDRAGRWIRRHRRALGRCAAAITLCAAAAAAAIGWNRVAKHELQIRAQNDQELLGQLDERLRNRLSDTTLLDERLSLTDPGEADALRQQIDEIVARWQPAFAKFPLANECEPLRRLYTELVLWRVQEQIARPTTVAQAQALLKELDQIVEWNPSPASYQRLRSTCLLVAGQSELATAAMNLSKQAKSTPFDHFLVGEQLRTEALTQRSADDESSLGLSDRSRLASAIAAYEDCLELDPSHFWAHLQKGRCLLVREEFDPALAEFDAAVNLRPQSPWAWSVRGLALATLHDYDRALSNLDRALDYDPEFTAAKLNRGAVRLLRRQSGDIAECKKEFADILKSHPGNIHAQYYLALAEQAGGNNDAALQQCSAILDSHPHLTAPRMLRVQLHLAKAKGDSQQARTDLDLWLAQREPKLDLKSPEAAARRCGLWRVLAARFSGAARTKTFLLALEEGQAALDAGHKSAQLYDDLAGVLIPLGRGAEALARIGEGLAVADSDPVVRVKLLLNRGNVLVNKTKPSAEELAHAKEDYLAARRLTIGDEPSAQIRRAEAHAMLGYIAALESDEKEAQRQTTMATAQLHSANHYTTWITLACNYNALADAGAGDVASLQETALALLKNAMEQARRAGVANRAAVSISDDPALTSLKDHPGFAKIVPNPQRR